ncbi:hypothetical protein GCM10023166_16150 [Paeniglutamicibacter cryotolerans]
MQKITWDSVVETDSDSTVEPISRRPLYQQVRDRVIQLVNDKMLTIGDQLPSERVLSAHLGVSRHSLRQAMSALEAQGLIEIRHGSGAYLVGSEPSQVASEMADALIDSSEQLPYVMEARFAIEPYMTGIAAERRTPADLIAIRASLRRMEDELALGESGEQGDIDFHAAVLSAARSPLLADFMSQLKAGMTRLREEALAQPTSPRLAVEAHYAILDAIEAGDRERASRAAHLHLVDAAKALLVSDLGDSPNSLLLEMSLDTTTENHQIIQLEPELEVLPVPSLASLTPYRAGESAKVVQAQTGLETVHKLASNENPYGCSKLASEAVASAATSLSVYPEVTAGALRTAVAELHGVKENQLVFGNGSDEVLLMIARAFLGPGRTAVACEPTFAQYRAHTLSTGAKYIPVPLEDGRTDPIALAAMAPGASVIWVCNPNNPTGAYLDAAGFNDLMAAVPKDVVVVVDEAYAEYVTAPDFPDAAALTRTYPNLIMTRTFSKIHGLAAIRIGYGIAGEKVANLLNTVRSPFNTSSLAQAAALASLKDTGFLEQSRERNARERSSIEDFCRLHGLGYYPSQSNFVLFDAPGGAENAFASLKERGYIVRPGTQLGFPTKIRMSVGTSEQITGALDSLKELL